MHNCTKVCQNRRVVTLIEPEMGESSLVADHCNNHNRGSSTLLMTSTDSGVQKISKENLIKLHFLGTKYERT